MRAGSEYVPRKDNIVRRIAVASIVSASCLVCFAEPNFRYDESNDKLSNVLTRKLIVTAEDGRSTIELRQTADSPKLTVFIDPANTIFPDVVDVENSSMAVSVTMRSSVMKEPATLRCRMNWMKYDFCYMDVPPKAARALFSGEHTTMQMARTADRMTFPMAGEEFKEALDKVLAPAEEALRSRTAADAIKKEEATRQEAAEKESQMAAEQERLASEEALKPATDGRAAGESLVQKLSDKVKEYGKTGITARAKLAAKKAGYEDEQAEMFVNAYVEAVQSAKRR